MTAASSHAQTFVYSGVTSDVKLHAGPVPPRGAVQPRWFGMQAFALQSWPNKAGRENFNAAHTMACRLIRSLLPLALLGVLAWIATHSDAHSLTGAS